MNFKNIFVRENKLSKDTIEEYNSIRTIDDIKPICKAPFTSLFFGNYGKVISCCFNRRHILGNYPQQSIDNIWEGKNIKELRKHINNNNLSMGCNICWDYLSNKNYGAVGAKNYDTLDINPNYPMMMEFELSNTCNFECIMCNGNFSSSIRKNRENDKNPYINPYDKEFVKQLEKYIPHLHKTSFYGGEPFVIDIYYDIWEKIIKLNPECIIFVQTNASVLNTKIEKLMSKGNFHFNVSLDSLQKDIFQGIRIGSDYDKVIHNINYFIEYCKNKNSFIGISACVLQQNWKELPDLVKYSNNKDIPIYFNTVRFPPNTSLWNLKPDELKKISDYLSNVSFVAKNNVQLLNVEHYNNVLNQINSWHKQAINREEITLSEDSFGLMKVELGEKIKNYIDNNKSFPNNEKYNKYTKCVYKLIITLNKFPDDFPLILLMTKLNEVKIDRLIYDLENETYNYNFERFCNLVYFHDMKPEDV